MQKNSENCTTSSAPDPVVGVVGVSRTSQSGFGRLDRHGFGPKPHRTRILIRGGLPRTEGLDRLSDESSVDTFPTTSTDQLRC